MKFFFVVIFVLCSTAFGVLRVRAMTSMNYTIEWDSINSGGNELGSSASYTMYDTVGQTTAGPSASASYTQEAGYRQEEESPVLAFTVGGQDSSSVVAYTAFDTNHPEYVAVSSVAGFTIGDYIAVVENGGYNAYVAMGRVTRISGGVLTVDSWEGDVALMSSSPTGGNDYVYRLDAATIPLGSITAGAERLALAGAAVFSSASNGYSVYIQADGALRTVGGAEIADVLDGAVSSDTEEYGAEAIGSRAVSSGTDLAVTSNARTVMLNPAPTVSTMDRALLAFKLGVAPATTPGNYAQTVYLTLTANF